MSIFFDRLENPPVLSNNVTQISLTEASDRPEFLSSNIQLVASLATSPITSNTIRPSVQAAAPVMLQYRNVTIIAPDRQRVIVGAIPTQSDQGLVYNGIDFDVYRGDRILIVGPSGCGAYLIHTILMIIC